MPFSLRAADGADYPVFARLFPELEVADPVLTPEQFASQMLPRVVILEEAGEALGYAWWRVYGRTAHVVHVVVDPRARGRGAGQALMQEVRRRVLREGCVSWYLNVKQDNAPAITLYQRCGLSIEMEGWATRITWAQLEALPPAPASVAPFTPQGDDDAKLAASLALDAQRVAQLRAREAMVLLGLTEAGAPVGFAAFDPAFPGVYPIRVARPELARPLFDALRPNARHEHVHVSVEGDRELFERLRAAGAQVLHAFYRMTAELA